MARVVIHADDFGLCQPVNLAIRNAFYAPVTATSMMAPCPGFDDAIDIYHANMEESVLDVGVHFTLTTGGFFPKYTALAEGVNSLSGDDGFLRPSVSEVAEHLTKQDVFTELSAQFDRVIKAGVDVTHLDAHMFVGSVPVIGDVMLEAGWERRAPVVLKREVRQGLASDFDSITSIKKGMDIEKYFANLQGDKGLHYLIIHPAVLNNRIAGHLPNTWQRRAEDFELCKSGMLVKWMAQYGLTATGMREIRDDCMNSNIWL